ncbi:MAG: helix-turn-helix transcriptional regulator [bacterium]|nr:helix-turn-helix transcriptional regulator [bacterium]
MDLKNQFKDELIALGRRLRAVRKAMRYQQKDIAAKIGMSTSYLSDIEAGKRNPGPEFFLKLAYDFNVNPNYLFLGKGEMLLSSKPKQKVSEFDFNRELDTVEQVIWLIENSPYFKNTIMGFASKLLLDNEDTVKLSIRKYITSREEKKE